MAILDTLIAELLKDGVNKATGGKGIAKKLEEAIKKESSGSKAKQATTAAEKRAIRNAFTLGAPSDDRKAKARAMAAQAIFNDLERSKASPEELAAAKREADSWANWASLPKSTRENILSRGRRQAELGNATSKFGAVMNELGGTDEMGNPRNKGAAELLRREAVANASGPRITGETITDGRVTNRQVAGRYGSGSVVDTGTRGAGDPRLRAQTEQLLLDQGARAGQSPSYAQQILADYQTRITPQGAMPQQQVTQAPASVAPQVPVMPAFRYQPDAYSILNTPASTAALPVDTPMAYANTSRASGILGNMQPASPVPVAPAPVVAAQPAMTQDEIDRKGLGFTNIGRSPAANAARFLLDSFTPRYIPQ